MIFQPTRFTLRKYGLTPEDWQAILDRQGGASGACGRVPTSGKFNIDHEHAKKWKDMPPEKRKQYVRGLLCWTCNSFTLAKGATAAKLERAAQYLLFYQQRKDLGI